MMNRIKNIKQLEIEKKRLKQRKTELEKAMRYDWRDLKESLRPQNIAGQAFSKIFGKKTQHEKHDETRQGFASEFFDRISARLAEKIGEKLNGWFKS